MTKTLIGIALVGVAALWAIDHWHTYLAATRFGFMLPFGHHLFAIVAGASTAGVLFEWFARESTLREFSKGFLKDEGFVALFADEEKQKWVGKVLDAQIAGDDDHSLSRAIFLDVVQPFMKKRKFRPRMHYSVSLREGPGWTFDSIDLPSADYYSVEVDFDFSQRLPPAVVMAKRINVSLVFSPVIGDLQRAFDDEACVYREHIMLPQSAAIETAWKAFGEMVSKGSAQLADLGLHVSMTVDGVPQESTKLELAGRTLRAWFPYHGGEQADLAIGLTAPYPKAMKYFEVVFGEPTASAHVTFRPGVAAKPHEVVTIDFLQGQRRIVPNIAITDSAVDVTFLTSPEANVSGMSHERTRWILPRSGLLFLWN